jgi:hypothetical protein
MTTELLKLLDELGDAHEAYAAAASLEEAQALEDRCKELRQKIVALVNAPKVEALVAAATAMVRVWDRCHGPATVQPVMGAELEALRARFAAVRGR